MATWAQFRMDASKHVSRKAGGSAIASAAYRAGEKLFDRREQQFADYSGRYGVVANGITMPNRGGPDWTREQLWNAADAAERRSDARTARKIELALPAEMTAAQRLELVQEWAKELAGRYGVAVDWAIHLPDRKGSEQNHHAHLMLTTREIGPEGFGGKAALELSNTQQKARGLPVGDQAMQELRQVVADRYNEVAQRLELELQADARSYRERGIELVPTRHIGVAGVGIDRRGQEAERAETHKATRELNAQKIEQRPELLLETLTGKDAVFSRRDMAKELHRYIDQPERFAAVMARLDASPELVHLSSDRGSTLAQFSTREMVRTEAQMIDAAEMMAATGRHLVAPGLVRATLDRHTRLSAEQRAAVEHVLAPGQIAAIVGSAGAGKSRSLAAAREAWEGQGYRVLGAALAGKAAEELQGSAGMDSRTLAALEFAWRKGRERLTARDVLVIDEAGMVGSRQLGRVLDAARQAGAKVVLVGDERQLQPIEAGAAFRAVIERVGSAEVREIWRQREEWARKASQALARGDVRDGLAPYYTRGHMRMEDSREAAKAAIARDYMAGTGSRLIMAHTNKDVRELNDAVRAEWQRAGGLTQEAAFATAQGVRQFAADDRLVFLANDRKLGVKNGTLGTVEQAGPGRLVVRLDDPGTPGSGRRVAVDQVAYDQVAHGYAVTIHKSQGATLDRTFVLASGGMDAFLAYVSLTRHRDGATLYAGRDDFGDERALVARLGRARPKMSTLDFAERRGFETSRAWADDARALLERGRERLEQVWERAGQAVERVREHIAQLAIVRTPQDRRREELREALGVSQPAQGAKTREQKMQERRETFGADKQDGGTGPQPLRETFSQPAAADPGAEARREALRASFAREEATRLTGEELRRAMREPEKPAPERGQGHDRGHDRER